MPENARYRQRALPRPVFEYRLRDRSGAGRTVAGLLRLTPVISRRKGLLAGSLVLSRREQTMSKLVFAALGLSILAGPAFGVTCPSGTIYATGFENPPFAAGSQLVGQDGWVGRADLSPAAATISTDVYYAGLQSVRVKGADLVHQDSLNTLPGGYIDAAGSYRRPVTCDPATGFPIVRVTAKVRIDGPKTPPGADANACVPGKFVPCNNFFSASVVARAGSTANTDGVGELALSSD